MQQIMRTFNKAKVPRKPRTLKKGGGLVLLDFGTGNEPITTMSVVFMQH